MLTLANFVVVGLESFPGVHSSLKILKWSKTAAAISSDQPRSPWSNWDWYITGLGPLANMQWNLELYQLYEAIRTKSWSDRIVPNVLRLSVTITNVVLHYVVLALLSEIFVRILSVLFEQTMPGFLASVLCLLVSCPAQQSPNSLGCVNAAIILEDKD